MGCNGCQFNNIEVSDRPDTLTNYDWLSDVPDTQYLSQIVELRFKGTRKEFFKNESKLDLKRGDKVVVSAQGGHDLGIVSLTGKLAEKQFDRKVKNKSRYVLHVIYRHARERDLERWEEAKKREKPVMIRSRQIAQELGLEMKIGDVEFRGDGNKAIFYYIADGRVDFRELIKHYAWEFNIKVEMKQIGARQEAARIGGFGSCGRELCCSSWRTDFSSITAHMASRQGLSSNAEKLTGSCGKLKCCLMYELDVYLEAQSDFPKELLELETSGGIARHFKTDILKREIHYNVTKDKVRYNFFLTVDRVKEIINMNKRGKKPDLASLLQRDNELGNDDKNMFNQNLTSGELKKGSSQKSRPPRKKGKRKFVKAKSNNQSGNQQVQYKGNSSVQNRGDSNKGTR